MNLGSCEWDWGGGIHRAAASNQRGGGGGGGVTPIHIFIIFTECFHGPGIGLIWGGGGGGGGRVPCMPLCKRSKRNGERGVHCLVTIQGARAL